MDCYFHLKELKGQDVMLFHAPPLGRFPMSQSFIRRGLKQFFSIPMLCEVCVGHFLMAGSVNT